MKQQKILIADSDQSSAQLTGYYLTQALFDARIITDPGFLFIELRNFRPDLVLIESEFPDTEKFQIFKELRLQSNIPVIIISSECDVSDRVYALEAGADDCLSKPYDARELLARIHAIMRRCQPENDSAGSDSSGSECVRYPDLTVSLSNYSVTYCGKAIDLPPRELELLYCMASSPNQVLSREQLLDRLWGYDYAGDTRTVDVHIKRLRDKFKSSKNWAIKTVWGIGYKFEVKYVTQ